MGWKRMIRFFWIVWIVLLLASCSSIEKSQMGAGEPGWRDRSDANASLRIGIVYDNSTFNPRLKPANGFSCLVNSRQKTILFDTGGNGPTLLENMAKMGIDPREIDLIMLSHNHPDHVGGLPGFLERNAGETIYLPGSSAKQSEERARLAGAKWVDVYESREISVNLFSTGILGRQIQEQSLVLKTSNGLVVITGCAHPGLITILQRAKEIGRDEVYLLLGGFHLEGHSASSIESIVQRIRDLGVKKVAPCHCSGDLARGLFRQHYGQDFIDVGVGKIILL
jgi:7,8-dihydropterin-6-yl-methyl-4-(beta-D-ribofuranosyl)aminobenzene 5'-phosphate synthase